MVCCWVAKIHPGNAPPGSDAQPSVRPPGRIVGDRSRNWLRGQWKLESIFFCWHPILCDGDDQNQPQNWAGVILNLEACALWLEEPHSADMPQPPQFSIALSLRLESGDSMCCQGTAKLSWPRLPHRGCWRFQPYGRNCSEGWSPCQILVTWTDLAWNRQTTKFLLVYINEHVSIAHQILNNISICIIYIYIIIIVYIY